MVCGVLKSVRRMYSNFCNGSSRVRSGGSVALGVTLLEQRAVIDAHGVQGLLHLRLIQFEDVSQRVLILTTVHVDQDFLYRIHKGLEGVLHHVRVIYRALHANLVLVLALGMLCDNLVD